MARFLEKDLRPTKGGDTLKNAYFLMRQEYWARRNTGQDSVIFIPLVSCIHCHWYSSLQKKEKVSV